MKKLFFVAFCMFFSILQAAVVPKGFQIELFASDVENVRQMALSDTGVIYAGSRRAGKVYAIVDTDDDLKADQVYVIAEDLFLPSGVAYKDGDLYVAEVDKIVRFENIDATYDKRPQAEVIFDDLPDKSHHGWKYIKFGPDGKLYIPVGVPCNVCLSEDQRFGTILRLDIETKQLETVATGVRNSVGFDWHPQTGELWFTDNGRDMMGDDIPPCELNRVSQDGEFFGFPYVHGKNIADPKFSKKLGKKFQGLIFTPPSWEYQAHVAPLGMMFYDGDMFPEEYKNSAFVALHGSWNRSSKVGYKVVNMRFDKNIVTAENDFVTGWLKGEEVLARPNDVIMLNDGSLLVSDDGFGKIYRVSYQP
ncbi:MAG: sorbosone dehydrogenase family protein [Kangiellaceae bacterium]|nr:sorbosone dehydrogenase family protein [Kangiellaceae bacterium]